MNTLRHKKKLVSVISSSLLIFSLLTGCSSASKTMTAANYPKKLVIGFSMDTLKEERWQKDRDVFLKRAKELGVVVKIEAANSDDNTQLFQAEDLILQGVDVLVIVPHNGDILGPIVQKAHEKGIKVLSYDRLIKNADTDYSISFDNEKVGELQAEAMLSKVSKGNLAYVGGAETDNNAILFRQGAMKILQPKIQSGDINLIMDKYTNDWKPDIAYANVKDMLARNGNKIDGIIAANDGTAGGSIQALSEVNLNGKVPVTGQDAEIEACQRVVNGDQLMTVFKPISLMASKAVDMAVSIAKNEKVETTGVQNNGKVDVPTLLLQPIAVDKDNMMDTVIKEGFHTKEEVFGKSTK